MNITAKQKRWLKQRVPHLKPVVALGQAGLTAAVLAEIDRALAHHELIKIRIQAEDRQAREALIATIAARTASTPIDRIGHTAALFRANPEKRSPLVLPADPEAS